MSRELRMQVGVLAEKRKAGSSASPSSPWAEDYWVPTGILETEIASPPGTLLRETDEAVSYYLGPSEIYCHASETEAYIFNFDSKVPVIFVILREDHENEHPLPWFVQQVTVSPYEAQDYADSAEDIIGCIPMPVTIATALTEFIEQHHKDEPFIKRKRRDYKDEQPQFGKEPIFNNRTRAGKPGEKND